WRRCRRSARARGSPRDARPCGRGDFGPIPLLRLTEPWGPRSILTFPAKARGVVRRSGAKGRQPMRAPQAPIGSGFGAATTAEEVIRGRDLTGKVAIVTGGYAGIGLETVKPFVSAGARVVVPARDKVKAENALAGLGGVTVEALDLMDPWSIDGFANRFLAANDALHILVNNAGIMAPPLARDVRGYESQFSTNH